MRKKLSFKINIAIAIVVTFIVACFGAFDYFADSKKRLENLQTEHSTMLVRLKTSLAAPLWNLNKAEIESIVRAEMLNRHIVSIEVHDNYSKESLIELGRSSSWGVSRMSPSSLPWPIYDAGEADIQKGDEVVGKVRVSVTDRFVRTESRNQIGQFLLEASLLLFLVVLSLIAILERSVLRPIAQMEAAFSEEEGREKGYNLDVEREDELGQLARSFISMRARLAALFSERDSRISALEAARQELQRSDENLRESEERFQKMFRSHNAVMLLVDPQGGGVVDANDSACTYYGYNLDQLKALSAREINQSTTEEVSFLLESIKAGEKPYFETKHRLASGESREVEVHSSAIVVSSRTLLFSIVHDITDRKKLMEEHSRSAQLAALGTVAAGVAHEINNPLQGILNYATMALNAPENHGRVVDVSQRIIKETERISKITRDLLHYAKDNRTDMLPSDVLELSESALSLMETKVNREGVRIVADFAEDLPKMSVYPQGYQQIIINLVDNAYDALRYREMARDEKEVRVRGRVVGTGEDSMFCLEVYDRGGGMPVDVAQKAKDAFFSTKPSSEGTGLGLSIVSEIVGKHNGQLEIETKEGDYTNVKVLLPVKQAG